MRISVKRLSGIFFIWIINIYKNVEYKSLQYLILIPKIGTLLILYKLIVLLNIDTYFVNVIRVSILLSLLYIIYRRSKNRENIYLRVIYNSFFSGNILYYMILISPNIYLIINLMIYSIFYALIIQLILFRLKKIEHQNITIIIFLILLINLPPFIFFILKFYLLISISQINNINIVSLRNILFLRVQAFNIRIFL